MRFCNVPDLGDLSDCPAVACGELQREDRSALSSWCTGGGGSPKYVLGEEARPWDGETWFVPAVIHRYLLPLG